MMVRKMPGMALAAMLAIAVMGIGVPQAHAEAITDIDGGNFSFKLSSPGGTNQTATIQYGDSFVTQLNHNSVTPALATAIGNMLLNTTPIPAAGGTQYNFQPVSTSQTIAGFVGTASFTLTGLT